MKEGKRGGPQKTAGRSPAAIRKDVRKFILENFLAGDHGSSLRNSDLLFEGGIVDSAGALVFISFLEERFRISVLDEELFPSNFASVNHVVDYVSKKVRKSRASSALKDAVV